MTVAKNALIRFEPRDSLAPLSTERGQRIQEVAYYKALQRHFTPGHELDDWLAAEEEVDDVMRRSTED